MLRTTHASWITAISALALIALLLVACGDSTPKLSDAQAQAISNEIFAALRSALVAGLTPPASRSAALPTLPETLQSAQPVRPRDCTISDNGESCNIAITYQGNCPEGGTIAIDGTFLYTLDNSGNGTDSSTLIVTPAACAVSDITFHGNPSLTFSTQFAMQGYALYFPIAFSGKGGITYGPNPAGSCSIDVSATATSPVSCTISGKICGRSVSGTC